MRRKICILLVVLIMIATFATVFTACHGGKYKMQDFVVDFTDFVKTYEVGDQIDLSTIKMNATFSDGTTEAIPLDKVTIKVDGEQISLNELNKITETTGTKIIDIKYSNVQRSVTIRVNEKHIAVLTGVEFDATTVVKQYNVRDAVSFNGLTVKAVYDGYEKVDIALTDENLVFFMNEEMITTANLSRITAEVGTKNIKVRYRTITSTTSFEIVVSDVLDDVTINVPATFKTNYKVGEAIATTGITATANYRSGRTENVTDIKYYIGTNEVNFTTLSQTKGNKEVTVKATYEGKTGEKAITFAVENYVSSIAMDTSFATLEFIADTAITINSFSDVKINVTYADAQDNTVIGLATEGVTCINTNGDAINFAQLTNTSGTKTIVVQYANKIAFFDVVVVDADSSLKSLSVLTNPTTTAYTAGATNVSLDGLVIKGEYKDELGLSDVTIAYADFATEGVQLFYNDSLVTDLNVLTRINPVGANTVTVSVKYLSKTTTFALTVTNSITELVVDTQPTKTAYYIEDDVDLTGLVVKANKNYGSDVIAIADLAFYNGSDNVTANLNAFTATKGTKTVTIKYSGFETTTTLTVADFVIGLAVQGTTSFETDVNKTSGSKFTTFTGLQVYESYKSGELVLVQSGYTFSGNEITVPGTKTVTVSYNGFDNNGITLVVKDVLNSIQVDPASIPTKIYKNGEVERFLISLRVLGNFEYKGQEELRLLQDDGISFLYGVVAFAVKEAGEFQELTQLQLDNIALQSGNRDVRLTYTYNGYDRSVIFAINVLEQTAGVNEFSLPQSLLKYNAALDLGEANPNEGDANYEGALFVDGDEEYLVGNDNAYKFVPTFNQIDITTSTITTLKSFAAKSTIYLVNGLTETALVAERKGTYTIEWTLDSVLYVTETTNRNEYHFSKQAAGKKFKLSVLPDPNEFIYDSASLPAVEWTVKVVNGYNVYDSREICLLEHTSVATREQTSGKYPTGRKYWDGIKTSLGLMDAEFESIILHDSLVVTKDSLPQDYWFTLPDNYSIYYKYTYSVATEYADGRSYAAGETAVFRPEDVPADLGGPLDRSFLWDQEWGLLQYDMANGETFSIHGNFFDIDLSKLPLVCSFEPNGLTYPDGRDAYYMEWMSKISFLDVRGYDVRYTNGVNHYNGSQWRYLTDLGETPTEDDAHDEHFIFENFMVKGNAAPKQLLLDASTSMLEGAPDNPVYGGGIIFVKTHYCHSVLDNINAHACFISFFSRDYTVSDYRNLKSYDSYLNAVYCNGETDVTLTNCHFKRAGGPLMIVTQGTDNLKNNGNDTSDYIEIPKLVANNDCVLENFVTGEEVWFDIFAYGQVSALKSLDALLNGYFHKTYLQGNSFNLICVSSQGQCYFSYKGEKLDRRSGGGPYKEPVTYSNMTTYDIISGFNGAGAPCFSVGDTMCAIGQTGGGQYYLQNYAQTELAQENIDAENPADRCPTIQADRKSVV